MPIKAVQQFMLGTVLSNEQQARETLAAMKAAGYDGIELCGFMIHPIGFVVKLLTKAAGMPVGKGGNLDWHKLVQEAGLQVVSLHTDLGSLERDAHAVAEEAKSFSTPYVVITGMYRFDYGDEAAMHELAQRLNKAGEALAAEGIHLLYHNHNCELRHVNAEKRAYDILLEETDPAFVNFEFDSYWFTEGGANALAWMQRLGPRMKLWHINDRGTRITGSAITPILKTDSMELGTGNMDLDSLMAQALAVEVDAVILESTATGWTILPSRASSSVQNTLHKNSDLPFSHHFLLHYPHKSNAPHRLLLPVRGVVFCGESFCVTGCGCPAARSGFCHPGG